MPAERVTMRRVREILRHRFEHKLGHKAISQRVGAAPSTVRETLRRAAVSEVGWPLGDEISDAVLEAALYGPAGKKTGHRRCPEPDWAVVHRELKRKHVTLQIVWDEYIAAHADGYRYSRFCDLYRGWAAKGLPRTVAAISTAERMMTPTGLPTYCASRASSSALMSRSARSVPKTTLPLAI